MHRKRRNECFLHLVEAMTDLFIHTKPGNQLPGIEIVAWQRMQGR